MAKEKKIEKPAKPDFLKLELGSGKPYATLKRLRKEIMKSKVKNRSKMRHQVELSKPFYGNTISKLSKKLKTNLQLSEKFVNCVNNIMEILFERIASKARRICQDAKVKTLSARAIRTATRKVLGGDLAVLALKYGDASLAFYLYNVAERNMKRLDKELDQTSAGNPPNVSLASSSIEIVPNQPVAQIAQSISCQEKLTTLDQELPAQMPIQDSRDDASLIAFQVSAKNKPEDKSGNWNESPELRVQSEPDPDILELSCERDPDIENGPEFVPAPLEPESPNYDMIATVTQWLSIMEGVYGTGAALLQNFRPVLFPRLHYIFSPVPQL